MSAQLTWKERNRDEVWKAARRRVADRLNLQPSGVLDYWVLDELHDDALVMVNPLREGDQVEHRNEARRKACGLGRILKADLDDFHVSWADGTYSWLGAGETRRPS